MSDKVIDQKIDQKVFWAEREIAKLEITDKDIVVLKGDWNTDTIQHLSVLMNAKKMNSILIVLPKGNKEISSMPLDQFYKLMKEVENRLGLFEGPDEVSGD